MGISSQVEFVCRIGQGANCCRYLTADGNGFHCAKLNPSLASAIDRRTDMVAKSDNCPGVPMGEVL